MPQAIHHLCVGPAMFGLAVEAIRVSSLGTGKLFSMNAAVARGAELALDCPIDRATYEPLLSCADEGGTIRLHLAITEAWAPSYKLAARRFEGLLERRLYVRHVCCLLLQVVVLCEPSRP